MQIVIDIDDNLYTRLFDNGIDNYDDAEDMATAIRNGTPLPKGHGDLKDADEMKKRMGNLDGVGMIGRCIDEFPIIVEADRSESEE